MLLTKERQGELILNELDKCVQEYGISVGINSTPPITNENGTLLCPAFFDKIMCWPPTPANTVASLTCPSYINAFNTFKNATRKCTEDGTWFVHPEHKTLWTNYSECTTPLPIVYTYTPLIKDISRVGYIVSLTALVVAFLIMILIKKLHCPRNKLHMNLFASFILRACFFLIKDMLFLEGVGFAIDKETENLNETKYKWPCKLTICVWEYFILANFSWILMEGLYLHNLIYKALFADCSRKISHYVILGWGLPVVVITTWAIVKAITDDNLCWTLHGQHNSKLILEIPINLSVIISMILFIKITLVIYRKLQAPVYEDSRRYQKWMRSTLVLVPLFGIHYGVFLGLKYIKNDIVELIWVGGDQLFGSFQGFFVALLYCFMNGEVRAEVKPYIQNILLKCIPNDGTYCFSCREKYLRPARTRSSVCTTLSCSSVYNNGVNNYRNGRNRWELIGKGRNSIPEKNAEHVCRPNNRSWNDVSRWNSNRFATERLQPHTCSSNRSIPETILSFDQEEKCRSEPLFTEEISLETQT